MPKRKNFSKFIFPLLLVLIVLVISWLNYTPGTILTGWDALHPEFNFPLAFKRIFFGVWREDQGLGALAVHAHMADLPRVLFLWFSSLIVPFNMLRYFYVFLSLALGPLGVYFFLKYAFKRDNFYTQLASFLGASYYLLNLGTLQHFYVPFEMFITQYAFLPWLFYLSLKFVEFGKRKSFLFFALFSFLASPMAYASTLFYAYLAGIFLFIFTWSVLSKQKMVSLKRSLIILVVIFATNAYWILPNTYSVFIQSSLVSSARINRLFSPEAFLRSKDYGGDIGSVLTHKNFLFSWRAFDFEKGEFIDLFEVWNQHFQDRRTVLLGSLFSVIFILGVLFTLLKKERTGLSFLPVVLLSLFFVVNTNPPLGNFYSYLIDRFGVFREGFRMPFTKFSILFMLGTSFYFGFFFSKVLRVFSRKGWGKLFGIIVGTFVLASLIFYMQPVFKGELIYPQLRTTIPSGYERAFEWFEQEDSGRIAKFPVQTLFNWEYHGWGYEGSGWFTWFSFQNPQLDRDFDRWSPFNETFYNEVSLAVYSKNLEGLEKILEKYQVRYLFLDESIINPGGIEDTLYLSEIKDLFENSEHISLAQKFGFLSIYETDFDPTQKFVWAPDSYTKVNADQTYSQIDPIYIELGNYIKDTNGISFPFINFDKRKGVEVSIKGDSLKIVSNPLSFTEKKELKLPEFKESDVYGDPVVLINDATKKIEIKLSINEKISEDFSLKRGFKEAKNCDLKEIGSVSKENRGDSVFYGAYDGGVSCDFYHYPDLAYSQGYILRIKGENRTGRGLKIYLFNEETRRMDLEELLPEGKFDEYFFILPKDIDGGGYILNVETRSFGRIASENVIETIEIVPFPYEWLTNIKLDAEDNLSIQNNIDIKHVQKFGTAHYLVDTEGNGLIVLSQGNDEGWNAYDVSKIQNSNSKFQIFSKIFPWWFGDKLEHVQVNTWENGWKVPVNGEQSKVNSQVVVIVFWPQYLEYVGLVILGTTLFTLFFYYRKSKRI